MNFVKDTNLKMIGNIFYTFADVNDLPTLFRFLRYLIILKSKHRAWKRKLNIEDKGIKPDEK